MKKTISIIALIFFSLVLGPGYQNAEAASCGSAARKAEAQTGGKAIGAPRMRQSGGRTVCVVTVLVSDPNGQNPPARRTVTVAAD